MYVLYEDNGTLKAETLFSESDSTLQVESASGKRSKIKKANVLFRFEQPAASQLLEQANALAQTLDIPFLWECAPQEEFDVADFGEEYFGHPPSAVEKTALVLALSSAPAYFHKRGKGKYRPAPPDILEAALAAIEKKKRQAEQQEAWTQQMVNGELPEEIASVASSFLTHPDKNSLQWKAFDAAVTRTGTSPEQLLLKLGVWRSPLALHHYRFLSQHFPKGVQHAPVDYTAKWDHLPLADVEPYSLDDSSTTEIDDAISVTQIDADTIRVGIHIAAPGLAVTRESALDAIARQRMTTIYLPGQKIPMLPEEIIQAFTLSADTPRPALSLYVTANLATGEQVSTETRLERIQVRENLRHDLLDDTVTEEALENPDVDLPYAHWLRPLWRYARILAKQREDIRGKPEGSNRVEYSIKLDGPVDDPDTPVRLIPRRRDAPLDRLVSEYMILTNNLWGGLLAQYGLPGIYRSQQAGRVRMSTHALPHEAIGVPYYAWSTSPLRRYVDMVNQWQLLAAAEHGVSARLVAPFKPKDADLYAIIGAFDAQYAAVNEYQSTIERFWCLRWLQQQGLQTVTASVLRDDLVRLNCAPLVVRVNGMPTLERGQQVMLDIRGYDELALELHCSYRETVI